MKWFALGIGALMIVMSVAYFYHEQQNSSSAYVRALAQARIDTQVTLNGQPYRVVDGKILGSFATSSQRAILSLAYAHALAERHPILDATGIDPTQLDAAAHDLSNATEAAMAAQASSSPAALLKPLFPIDFLNALSELERVRQAFIASGSDTDEARYLAQLRMTQSAGLGDAQAFSAALSEILRDRHAKFTIPELGGAYSSDSMQKGAQHEVLRMREVGQSIDALNACLNTDSSRCVSEALLLPRLPSLPSLGTHAQMGAVRSIDIDAMFHGHPGRTVQLSSSACLGALQAPYDLLDESGTMGPNTPFVYIDDIYFESLSTSTANAFGKYFIRTYGSKYMYSNPMTFYHCPEVLNDYSRVLSIEAIADFAGTHPSLFPQLGEPLKNDVLRESDALAYLRALIAQESAQPDQYAGDANRLALLYTDRTVGLEKIVREASTVVSHHAHDFQSGIPFDTSTLQLYVTHSGMQSFYLSDNPTAGRTDASFRIDNPKNLQMLSHELVDYNELIASTSRAAIMKDIHLMDTFEGGW